MGRPLHNPIMLASVWQSQLRANLHDPSSWATSSETAVSLLYVPTGAGFCGAEQLNAFCSAYPVDSHPFSGAQLKRSDNQLQSISCVCDEQAGTLSEEMLLSWTQQGVRLPWLLPSVSFPLRRFELSFSIHAKLCRETRKLLNVRVHWDQGALLKQLSAFNVSCSLEPSVLSGREISRRLTEPLTPALMNPLAPLPSAMKRSTSLNSLSSIIADLPAPTELAVTPKMPSRTRSINPALLSSMRLGADADSDDEHQSLPSLLDCAAGLDGKQQQQQQQKITALTDSPAPAHIRAVRSRVFDQEDPEPYRPIMGSNNNNSSSSIFDPTPEPYKPILPVDKKRFESRVFDDEPPKPHPNMAQTNRVLFQSRVFGTDADTAQVKTGNAQPLQESHFIAPEDDLKLGAPEGPAATLSRPQMQGHFKGAQLGETTELSTEPSSSSSPLTSSKAAVFNPNKSQIILADSGTDADDSCPPPSNFRRSLGSTAAFNPNRSQIIFDFDDPQSAATALPSSRVTAPPGGHASIEL